MATFDPRKYIGPTSGLQYVDNDDGTVVVNHCATGFCAQGDNREEAEEKLGLFLQEYYKIHRSAPGRSRLDLSEEAN